MARSMTSVRYYSLCRMINSAESGGLLPQGRDHLLQAVARSADHEDSRGSRLIQMLLSFDSDAQCLHQYLIGRGDEHERIRNGKGRE
jgi:hypothetical protein